MHNTTKLSCVFYDTETTWKNEEKNDQIIQIAARTYGDFEWNIIESNVEEKFSATKKIWFGAMATHHITESMIEWKAKFEESETYKLMKRLNDEWRIFVAHNAKFDNQMMLQHWIEVKRYICTFKLARYVLFEDEACESHNLQYLRYYFGLEFDERIDAHDALSDVLVLVKVFEKLFQLFIEKEADKDVDQTHEDFIQQTLRIMERISKEPSLIRVVPFGKHKWKTFEELARTDFWYITRYFGQSQNDPDIVHSMKTAMKKVKWNSTSKAPF